jgi:DNA invertase Pin-like site-specific DNA recombinase
MRVYPTRPRIAQERDGTVKREDSMHDDNESRAANDRAVIYMRVNHGAIGDPQVGAVAIEYQREACRLVAEERGLTIVGEYIDRGGAISIERRPVLWQLLEELSARDVRYVIVSDLARISRNVRDMTIIEERLMQAGVGLLVYGEGEAAVQMRRRIAAIVADFDPRHHTGGNGS